MRKILYPLFLLAVVGTIGAFFWDNFSPFWQKAVLVIGVIAVFFIFRGLLFAVFGFLFDHLSTLLKWIISLLLFALIAWGVWAFIPDHLQEKLLSLRPEISEGGQVVSSTIGDIKDAAGGIGETVGEGVVSAGDTAKNQLANAAQGAADGVANGVDGAGKTLEEMEDALTKEFEDASSGDISGNTSANNAVNTGADPQAEKNEAESRNSDNAGVASEKNGGGLGDADSSRRLPAGGSDGSTDTWKEPLVRYEETNVIPEESPLAVESKQTVAKMKEANIQLVNSGPSDNAHIVVFPREDAQVVYPAEYTLRNTVFTSGSEVYDRADFTVFTPSDERADVRIDIVSGGAKYKKYAPVFAVNNSDDSNIFYVTSQGDESITYTTFFEGKMWDISITLPGAESESDFYALLKPVRFEYQD